MKFVECISQQRFVHERRLSSRRSAYHLGTDQENSMPANPFLKEDAAPIRRLPRKILHRKALIRSFTYADLIYRSHVNSTKTAMQLQILVLSLEIAPQQISVEAYLHIRVAFHARREIHDFDGASMYAQCSHSLRRKQISYHGDSWSGFVSLGSKAASITIDGSRRMHSTKSRQGFFKFGGQTKNPSIISSTCGLHRCGFGATLTTPLFTVRDGAGGDFPPSPSILDAKIEVLALSLGSTTTTEPTGIKSHLGVIPLNTRAGRARADATNHFAGNEVACCSSRDMILLRSYSWTWVS
jgi:hypothetical protein